MTGDLIRLTKSDELQDLKPASHLYEEAWQTLSHNKQALILPALVVGISLVPTLAFREGEAALSALTGRAVETGSADLLNSELLNSTRIASAGENGIISKMALDGNAGNLGRSLSEHLGSALGKESQDLAGSTRSHVSIAEGRLLPGLPEFEGTPPLTLSVMEPGSTALNKYTPGENIVNWVNVDGEYRSFMTHIPKGFDPAKPAPMVVALDGFLVKPKNPFNGMANSNGMIEQSDRLGFLAVFPVPKPRYADSVFSWNEASGSTNFLGVRNYSDTDYIKQAMQKIMDDLPVDRSRVYGVGFSQGALQLHDLVSKSPAGTFRAIASVAGTTTDRTAAPPAGTRLLVIHSQGDPTLPYAGGTGTIPGLFDKMTWHYAQDSKPYAQVQRYLEANNITSTPKLDTLPDLTIRTWNSSSGEPFVQEILLDGKYGHTFPGRPPRPTAATFFTMLNGIAAPPTVLDAKRWITEGFFGLNLPKAGERILAS